MTEFVETVTVSFEGDGSGTEELNWGQQHIWGAIQNLGATMNMGAVRELDPTARIEDFADELRFYLSRFQAMRTLLRYRPDALPLQVVVASGEAPLGIVDLAPDDDAAAGAAALLAELSDRPFSYESEFPIRMAVVRHRGVLTHLVTVLSHFATDGAGAFAMYEDFVHRDPLTGQAATPVRTQPLDLTVQQRSPAGRRQSDASLRYWQQQLSTLAARRPRIAVETGESRSRYRQLETRSVPMMLGATRIAHRLECDVSAVLLGLFAIALARVTGDQPSAAQMLVSNRFRPGLADIVGNVSQTGLFVVDVADCTVDEVVERAQRAATRTYKHAYFDLAQWRELLEKEARERGEDIALCYYNDRPSQRRGTAPGNEPSVEQVVAAARVASPVRWTDLPFFNERLMVTIDNVVEEAAADAVDAVTLLVLADTWFVPRAEMEEIARLMESLAVAAGCDPGTVTGVEGGGGGEGGEGGELMESVAVAVAAGSDPSTVTRVGGGKRAEPAESLAVAAACDPGTATGGGERGELMENVAVAAASDPGTATRVDGGERAEQPSA